MNYLVLGAGQMAQAAVYDLLQHKKTQQITVADHSEEALRRIISANNDARLLIKKVSVEKPNDIVPLMKIADGVLSAVPYTYNVLLSRWAIDNGCHFVDLGGNNDVVEQQFSLSERAKKQKVRVIPDCGLAPGMVSVVSAKIVEEMDGVEQLHIRVGGLPADPKTPLNYMLVFSAHGLINEYIEPAVILKQGQRRQVASMTGLEKLFFPPPFGELEAFFTSGGTSTLPLTYEGNIQTLDYKTIRYPGHCALMKAMLDLNFAEEKRIRFQGHDTSPRDLFEALLQSALTFKGEDLVLVRIMAEGLINGIKKSIRYQAIEYGDKKSGLTAMMRTTAFPATIILQMLVEGQIKQYGVLRQEQVVPPKLFLQELAKREINLHREQKDI
jgi:lysine 6-dehydrogenase